jgi:tRNA pseudouridine synthase B
LALGVPGTMTQLCRTQVGPFSINESFMAEEIMVDGPSLLQPADLAISHLPKLVINDQQELALTQGKKLSPKEGLLETQVGQIYRVYGPRGFMGLVKRDHRSIKVEKNLFL